MQEGQEKPSGKADSQSKTGNTEHATMNATKTATVKATKAAAAKKAVATKPAKPAKERTERQIAKDIGLGLAGYKVLQHLAKVKKEQTYREIEAATGYYSNLTAVLRKGNEGSLCTLKFATETENEDGPLTFKVTAAGVAALKK